MTQTPQRPTSLPVLLDNVPEPLRAVPRWVLWKYTLVDRGIGTAARQVWAKVPKQANGRNASSTKPDTWCSFDAAAATYRIHPGAFDGLGFIFNGTDGWVGVDLDDCVTQDVLTGEPEYSELALDAMARLPGYWELSPSGTGVKCWMQAPGVGAQVDKNKGIEVYDAGRYFAVTGHVLEPMPGTLAPETEPLRAWIQEHLGTVASKQQTTGPLVATGDDALDAFLELNSTPQPLDDWTVERVRAEIGPHLDIESHYDDWIKVGAAMHHQFEGSDEGLELWDALFQNSSKYNGPEYGAERWRSFGRRGAGAKPVTLGSLIAQTKAAREADIAARGASVATPVAAAAAADDRAAVQSRVDEYVRLIEGAGDAHNVHQVLAERAAKDRDLTSIDRAGLAKAAKDRLAVLRAPATLAELKKLLVPRFSGRFPEMSTDGRPLHTLANVQALCTDLGIEVRYDVITKRDEIQIPNAEWSEDNRDVASLTQLHSECHKAEFPLSKDALRGYVTLMGDLNHHNAPLDWIDSKPWDGVDRIDALIGTVVSPMDAELKRTLMVHWFVAAVKALRPEGIMARGVLVFQGAQYQGKTRWIEALAPEQAVGEKVVRTGVMLDVANKDSTLAAISCWLAELGELDATMRRSDISALKAFLSQRVDRLRKPYAAAESTFPRRTVFFATVNGNDFLHDSTGSSRFWVIPVTRLDPDHTVDMQQFWAQIASMERAGALHYPSAETMARLNEHNTDFESEDMVLVKIREAFAWGDPMADERWVSSAEILSAIGVTRPGVRDAMSVSTAIRKLGGGDSAVRRSSGKRLFRVPVGAESLL